MSGPFGSSQWMYSSGGFYPTELEQSLRVNQSDTAYLTRTLADSEGRIFTFSAWVKRGNMTATSEYVFATSTGSSAAMYLYILNQKLYYWDYRQSTNGNILESSAVFRDPSAWYHIVLKVDRTAATAADRAKLYVNGEEISYASTTYPNQNEGSWANENRLHYISNSVNTVDGYLAEVNFIDGQALDPTSFGEFKSGVWVAKEYTGSYGTNGFYLNFSDSANIGDDLSGNANDWTANNLVATDVVPDSPTNNFAVLSPLDKYSTVTLSQGNLAFAIGEAAYRKVKASMGMSSGKWYCEVFGASDTVGICSSSEALSVSVGISASGYGYINNGNKFNNSVQSSYGASWNNTNIIGIAYDADAGSLTFYKDGVSQGTAFTSVTEEMFFAISAYNLSSGGTFNFGQDSSFAGNKTPQGNTDDNGVGDFYYAPPAGYLALCTANLPDPVIDPAQDDVPSDYFNTVLYSGDGTLSNSVTGIGFAPDWLWLKSRSGAYNHQLYDVVRGDNNSLRTNSTNAESTLNVSLDSDGFTLGDSSNNINGTGVTYVAWNWLAGNGTSSNTDGSITSTVSVNQKAGFSVVGYTGNGTAGATVGHGLGAAPEMIILKDRDGTDHWRVYTSTTGATKTLYLSLTNAAATDSTIWNNTAPTSSVFTIGNDSGVNTNTNDYIAYCFAEVEGYSKFGSYTGNGSTDGPMIWTGFRPAFVMIKETSGTGDWHMYDVARNPYNLADEKLRANTSGAETVNAADSLDFVSNGMKLRNNGSAFNASGDTYIFMAFAENPFKYANAR